MKNLGIMLLVVMLMAGGARAVIIFEEDFTGTAVADITTLGWTKLNTGSITISDTEIDNGQSAEWEDVDAVGNILYRYDFPDATLADSIGPAGEYFQLTIASRAMDDIMYLYLYGRTHFASNGFNFNLISHSDNVWAPGGSPEKVGMYSTLNFLDESADLASENSTAWLRLIMTPGVNGVPLVNPGSRTLYYSEVSDSGPWTEVYKDTTAGATEVHWIDLHGGYAPTGQPMALVDSIKLEKLVWMVGDVNGDGFVGGFDITQIITNWGMTGAQREDGDLNNDGTVGGADYTEVLTAWGSGTLPPEPGTVPEPATIGIFLLTGTMLLARRRR